MMGLAKMTPDGWEYYASEIALGGEDYFAGHGDEPGRWIGRGAEGLGLSGEATPEELSLLFGQGRHPGTGQGLGRPFPGRGPQPVAGYAMSFSPPKSVSILWALSDPAVASEVRAAHDAAVDAALDFLEDHAAFTRRGKGGAVQADTNGYVAAAFTHRTSRALDPQLHTHVLVANKVRASSDGHWLSIDGRELFEAQKAAGLMYKAGLRAELTGHLGVAWAEVDRDGGGEIDGVPEPLVARFSKRRDEVLARGGNLVAEKEKALGRSLTGAERAEVLQVAAFQTRAPKGDGSYTTTQLRARWREQAIELNGDPHGWLETVLRREPGPAMPPGPFPFRTQDQLSAEVLAGLEAAHSTWGRADVVEALAVRLPPAALTDANLAREVIDDLTDEVLQHADVVRLGAEPATVPEPLRRRDGMTPAVRHGGARYTTKKTLAGEQAILELTEQGRDAGIAVVADEVLERASAEAGLAADQTAAVARLCQSGEKIAVLVGPAGSGKSRSLAAARAAWETAGIAVRGVAPSAVAAGVLGEQAGIASDTLAKFLLDVDRHRTGLRSGEVVVCDEASMVSTADLARLVVLVDRADAKLVLVGDHRQLGSVDAGGLFRLLTADAHTAELTAIRRFTDPWEAAASTRLRAGDRTVLSEYQSHDRVTSGDRADTLDAAHQAWATARAEGRSVVVMAPDHDTVNQLAARARAALVAAGHVTAAGVTAGEQTVGVGDEVITTRNDRRLVTGGGAWVRNGDRWQIRQQHPDGSLLLDSLDDRGRVTVPADYVTDHLALAYAVTVHKSQGITVDQAVLVVDDHTAAEHLYVGMTRGRHTNHAYVVCEPVADDHRTNPTPTAYDVLAAVLQRSAVERSATETHRDHSSLQMDLRALRAALEEARRQVDAAAGPDHRAEIHNLRRHTKHYEDTAEALAHADDLLRRAALDHAAATADVARAHQGRRDADRSRWLRGPDRMLQRQAQEAVFDARGIVARAERDLQQAGTTLEAARRAHDDGAKVFEALQAAVSAQQARDTWLTDHPDVVAHLEDLGHQVRLAAESARAAGPANENLRADRTRHPLQAWPAPTLDRPSYPAATVSVPGY